MKIINDLAFRSFFGKEENKDILSLLLGEILKIDSEYIKKHIKYISPELEVNNIKENKSITDILIEVDKYVVDIEAYTKYNKRKKIKSLIYINKILNKYYNNKNEYINNKKIIQINIIEKREKNKKYYVRDNEKKYIEEVEIIEINIDIEEATMYTISEQLKQWCELLKSEITDKKRIREIIDKMKYSEGIKKEMKERIIGHMTKEFLEEIGTTWEERYQLDLAVGRDEIREEATREGYEAGKEQGIKAGVTQGIEQGIKKGIEQGYKEGYKTCKRDSMITLAVKMISNNYNFKEISKLTGLSLEKIEDLSSNIKVLK